jgi:hypothetical protein
MAITTEQAQEILNNVHKALVGWKEQNKVFHELVMRDRDNQAAKHLETLLGACIGELEAALGDYRSPSQWKTDLLKEVKEVMEKHGG